jgi:hypothetical protein
MKEIRRMKLKLVMNVHIFEVVKFALYCVIHSNKRIKYGHVKERNFLHVFTMVEMLNEIIR